MKTLNEAELFYINKHYAKSDAEIPSATDSIIQALGRKDSPELREAILKAMVEAYKNAETRQAKNEIILSSAGGKRKIAAMTAAAAMRADDAARKQSGDVSPALKGCVHKIESPFSDPQP